MIKLFSKIKEIIYKKPQIRFYIYHFTLIVIFKVSMCFTDLKKGRTLLYLFMGGLFILLITMMGSGEDKTTNSRIQKIIKTHNSVKETNSQFPTVRKPPSSTETLYRGDSIRIIPLNK